MTMRGCAFKKLFKITSFKKALCKSTLCMCVSSGFGVKSLDQAVLAQPKSEKKINKNSSI